MANLKIGDGLRQLEGEVARGEFERERSKGNTYPVGEIMVRGSGTVCADAAVNAVVGCC